MTAIGLDVHEIFLQLTSLTRTPQLRCLLQSPFTMHERVLELIRGQADNGDKGRIMARMNALTEPQVIEALYAASRAGCRIDLVVRGTCALRPGGSRHVREHPRTFHRGPLPGTSTCLVLW